MKISQNTLSAANQLYKDISSGFKSREVTSDKQSQMSLEQLEKCGFSKEVAKAVSVIGDMGIELSTDDLNAIKAFMASDIGTTEEKLMALTMVINKQLPLTEQVIIDVHSARTVSLVDFLQSEKTPDADAKTPDVAYDSRNTLKPHAEAIDVFLEVLYASLDENNLQSQEKTEKATSDKEHQAVSFKRSEALGKDDDLAIDTLLTLLQAALIQGGEENLTKDFKQFDAPETKIVLEQTITPHLLEIKKSFEKFKYETFEGLKALQQGVQKETLSPQQQATRLSKLIDKIDQTIMKSKVGLYISMKGERELLKQSSKLGGARTALLKGYLKKSKKIVAEVLKTIDTLSFKPTIKKAVAIANPSVFTKEEFSYDNIVKWAKSGIINFSDAEKSSALLTHYLRRLGMNHETEVFQKVFGRIQKNNALPTKSFENLKSLLLQLSKATPDKSDNDNTQKILSHINGQQMHLKVSDKVETQQLFVNIPMSLQGHLTDVKVFIKSKQSDLKADWQNFNMFFVLDTRRYGDVGIVVSAIDKKVRIDIHNDNARAEAAIMPLVDMLKDKVEGIGFTVTGLSFSKWQNNHPNRLNFKLKSQNNVNHYDQHEGGMDIRI